MLTDGDTSNDKLKLDLRSASYDDIMYAWSHQGLIGDNLKETGYTYIDGYNDDGSPRYGALYRALSNYFEK